MSWSIFHHWSNKWCHILSWSPFTHAYPSMEPWASSSMPRRVVPAPPPIQLIEGQLEFEVEAILDSKIMRNKLYYFVYWLLGYSASDWTWEPVENLNNAPELVAKFHQRYPKYKLNQNSCIMTPRTYHQTRGMVSQSSIFISYSYTRDSNPWLGLKDLKNLNNEPSTHTCNIILVYGYPHYRVFIENFSSYAWSPNGMDAWHPNDNLACLPSGDHT